MIKYKVILLTFLISACATWDKDRVRIVGGKNNLIVNKNEYCTTEKQKFDKIVAGAIDLSSDLLRTVKSCTLEGPNESTYLLQKKKVKDFFGIYLATNYHKLEGQSLKEFNACFYVDSASHFVSSVIGDEVVKNFSAMVSVCSNKTWDIFEIAASPQDFKKNIEIYISDEFRDVSGGEAAWK